MTLELKISTIKSIIILNYRKNKKKYNYIPNFFRFFSLWANISSTACFESVSTCKIPPVKSLQSTVKILTQFLMTILQDYNI